MPRTSRIRSDATIRSIIRTGKAERGALFASHAAPNPDGRSRLAVVVSRRVSTRAVDRNRIKRQIRECYRTHTRETKGLDLVVIARTAARGRTSTDVREQLCKQWIRLTQR